MTCAGCCQNRPFPRIWAPVGDWGKADWESHPELREGVTLYRVPDEMAEVLREHLGEERVAAEPSREQWEYLYSREELAALSGNKFHKKKNLVNQYRKLYGIDYRTLDVREHPAGLEDVLQLQEEWCRWRDCRQQPLPTGGK